MNPPLLDFGGSGAPLYFFHANGYPPACYRPMLMHLAGHYHVTAMVQRPLWPESRPEELADWLPLTDDLLRFLEMQPAGTVACIGHSMGGIALLRAALCTPERFRAIVLIDPVLFPPRVIHTWQVVRLLGLSNRLHPLIAATRERRSQFDDLDRLFAGYRRKPVFKYMDDEALRAYVEGIACPDGYGYQLCYSTDWEMRIYETGMWSDMDIWRVLPGLQPPTLILRGAETDTFWASTGRLMQRKQPKVRVETVAKSTHLLPLERPREVSKIILSFLEETL